MSTECDSPPRIDSETPRSARSRHRHARGLTAYYRLRAVALEAQVAALSAELDRKDKRLQETIARYEEILQHRPDCDATVVAPGDD